MPEKTDLVSYELGDSHSLAGETLENVQCDESPKRKKHIQEYLLDLPIIPKLDRRAAMSNHPNIVRTKVQLNPVPLHSYSKAGAVKMSDV